MTASYSLVDGTRGGLLTITADVPADHHIFSLTQPAGGPLRTKLKLAAGQPATIETHKIVTEPSAELEETTAFGPSLTMELHRDQVVWRMPITLTVPGDETPSIDVVLNGQICGEGEGASCIPVNNLTATADFAGPLTDPALLALVSNAEPPTATPTTPAVPRTQQSRPLPPRRIRPCQGPHLPTRSNQPRS